MGRAILTPVDDISERSRTAGGVKLINVAEGDKVVGAAF
jgi:DNA gyrase/topoisomerase IV subunit A